MGRGRSEPRGERRRRGSAARARGFTLIEIIAVVAIMALSMALVIPALMNLSPTESLRADARSLASAIDLQRGTAIGRGESTGLVYNIEQGTYQLYAPLPGNPQQLLPVGMPERLSRHVRIRGIQAQGTRYMASGELRVRFDPSSVQGSHIIHLENTKGQLYSVKYNALLGQALAVRGEAIFEEARP